MRTDYFYIPSKTCMKVATGEDSFVKLKSYSNEIALSHKPINSLREGIGAGQGLPVKELFLPAGSEIYVYYEHYVDPYDPYDPGPLRFNVTYFNKL